MNHKEKLDKIRSLEQEHVDIFNQLLRILDELYLERSHESRKILIKDEQESLLRLRRQMQKGLEESAAILRTLERNDKLQAEGDGDPLSLEDVLASRVRKIMDKNHKLESEAIQLVNERVNLEVAIGKEESRFLNLRQQLQELDEKYGKKPEQTNSQSATDRKNPEYIKLNRQNVAMRELLTALRIHSGSGVIL
ncbi:Inner kinetochore subunit MCM16 [Nakaseomyces bracarensis]|uniref:Inner kinetochore subunit MCM16 n=1 Tax=Nakaseomyces bracarensis TaxID=273131 RepID=A0ABR4P091_9SACH